MIRNTNENGSVNVSTSVYTDIAGAAAIIVVAVVIIVIGKGKKKA